MKQSDLTARFVQRPQNYAWFLGAGTSRNSGLRTATDILLDMKRRYYRQEEDKDISPQDIQNEAVQARIQSFMDARGFPEKWAEDEYTAYFEKIFGDDKERQRKYISAILSEDNVTLSVGNRVLAALMSEQLARAVFTTNFDSVVEKAVAEMSGRSLSAYHLEGAHNAKNALDNEEYPFYCKLHGDFRYDTIKNLSDDLEKQNDELSACLLNAGNRFGFIVAGYSGRDKSVMELFHRAVETQNPFPHGLFWTGIKGSDVHPAVLALLESARDKGVDAQYVEVETFDAFMLRLWRNLDGKSQELDERVRKARLAEVNIEIPPAGEKAPLLRLNAFPILSTPQKCLSLSFKSPKEWDELREATRETEQGLVFTKSDTVWCWGTRNMVKDTFGDDIENITSRDVPSDITAPGNLHVKGFVEEALCVALSRNKPLLARTNRTSAYLIADPHTEDVGAFEPLSQVVGKTSGIIPGLFATAHPDDIKPQQVSWSEAVSVSIDYKNGQLWLLIDPDVWIWPRNARKDAREFLDKRRSDRFNKKYNELLDAWREIILGTGALNAEVSVSTFAEGDEVENPVFIIGSRTAFSRRLAA